jgi:putative FmdB family regulatory protein
MPIYEFACKRCGSSFETRVARVGQRPEGCPSCGSADLEKLMSSFAAHTSSSADAAPCAAGGNEMSACGMGEACGRFTGRCAN